MIDNGKNNNNGFAAGKNDNKQTNGKRTAILAGVLVVVVIAVALSFVFL